MENKIHIVLNNIILFAAQYQMVRGPGFGDHSFTGCPLIAAINDGSRLLKVKLAYFLFQFTIILIPFYFEESWRQFASKTWLYFNKNH